jgi:hypothetical protein
LHSYPAGRTTPNNNAAEVDSAVVENDDYEVSGRDSATQENKGKRNGPAGDEPGRPVVWMGLQLFVIPAPAEQDDAVDGSAVEGDELHPAPVTRAAFHGLPYALVHVHDGGGHLGGGAGQPAL